MENALWTHKGSKFVIGTLHGEKIEITAQYNPKDLSRQSTAAWNVHQNTAARHTKTAQNHLWMEYGNTEPRTVTLELTFDGYEEGLSIAKHVENLERLTLPVDMQSAKQSERRPQLCVAVWGSQTMRCVVTSVATKLTMFDSSGEPLRATCTVALKEVDVVAMMAADRDSTNVDARESSYARDSRTSRQLPYPPEDSKPTRVPQPNTARNPPPAAPAKTVGKPSSQINPAALDGTEPGTGPLFEDESPAPAPSPAVGKPSSQINPAALDGAKPGTGPLFKDQSPDPVGTADPKMKAAYDDLE